VYIAQLIIAKNEIRDMTAMHNDVNMPLHSITIATSVR